MRSDVVLLSEPLVDDGLGLLCRREPFGILPSRQRLDLALNCETDR